MKINEEIITLESHELLYMSDEAGLQNMGFERWLNIFIGRDYTGTTHLLWVYDSSKQAAYNKNKRLTLKEYIKNEKG